MWRELRWANGKKGRLVLGGGNGSEGREAVRTALRLNPRWFATDFLPFSLRHLYYIERTTEPQLKPLHGRFPEYPAYPNPYRWLAASLGQLGRADEAQEAVKQGDSRFPDGLRSACPKQYLNSFCHGQHEHLLEWSS